jgi:hypothetical protein
MGLFRSPIGFVPLVEAINPYVGSACSAGTKPTAGQALPYKTSRFEIGRQLNRWSTWIISWKRPGVITRPRQIRRATQLQPSTPLRLLAEGLHVRPEGPEPLALRFRQTRQARLIADAGEVRVFPPVLEGLDDERPGCRRA